MEELIVSNTPLFIVFEGIDGSGKSSQAEMLFKHLKDNGVDVIFTAEPSMGKWGREIRKILSGDIIPHPEEQLELFIKDREDDVERNIIPSFEKKQSIVMDRYFYSNAAYQGHDELTPEFIIEKNLEMGFPVPHRVYLIDIEPEVAMERILARSKDGSTEIFEKRTFLEKVRANFLKIADSNFKIIDGSMSIEKIFKEIVDDMKRNVL